MTQYQVQVTFASTQDFARLRAATDIIPGTVLIEDPEFPELLVPVTAQTPDDAVDVVENALWDEVGPFLLTSTEPLDEGAGG